AAVLAHRRVHRRQPQAGTLAEALGGIEGLEYVVQNVGMNARSGIAYGKADVVPGASQSRTLGVTRVEKEVARLEGEPASLGHRVARVDREVENDLLHL